jgi:hypothetical protein
MATMTWQEKMAAGWLIVPCDPSCDDDCRRSAPEFHEWEMPDVSVPTASPDDAPDAAITDAGPGRVPDTELRVDDEREAGVAEALARVRDICSKVMPYYGPFEDRNAAMADAYRAGATFRQLSEAAGLTAERCRQVVHDAGVEARGGGWQGMSERSRESARQSKRKTRTKPA